MLFIFSRSYLDIIQNSKGTKGIHQKSHSGFCPPSSKFFYLEVVLPFSFIFLQRWFIYVSACVNVITSLFIQMIELLHILYHTLLFFLGKNMHRRCSTLKISKGPLGGSVN